MRYIILIILSFGMCCVLAGQNNIKAYEYWFNDDHNGKIVNRITPSSSLRINETVPTTGLLPGVHVINFRTLDKNGVYSNTLSSIFYKSPSVVTGDPKLTTCEYWFDNDPGSTTLIPFTETGKLNISSLIPVSDLSAGLHSIHIRFRDNRKIWSSTLTQFFFKTHPHPSPESLITGYRYWLDDNLANAMNVDLSTPASDLRLVDNIILPESLPGDYLIHFQFRDNRGVWSTVTTDVVTVHALATGAPDEQANRLTVFPNPTTGKLAIITGESYAGMLVIVSDIRGKTIQQFTAGNETKIEFDISGPDGIYFITLYINNQKRIYKIIKH